MFRKSGLATVALLASMTGCGGGGEDGGSAFTPPSYGAIALNAVTGAGGITANYASQSLANSEAIKLCTGACTVVLEFGSLMCGALARSTNLAYGWASNSKKSNAESTALSNCVSQGGKECVIVLSQCNTS